MNSKQVFYSESAYVFGIIILALGTAMMEWAGFGMSMVVAPAYLLHLKISQSLPAFSFGMAEYCLQALILIVLAIILRKIKLKFLLSLGTAVFYGIVLDGMIWLIGLLPDMAPAAHIAFYVFGMVFCSAGVSLLFHTYVTPEAYELFVKEIAARFKKNIPVIKTVYDCCSCLIAVVMSFLFFGFGNFEGIKLGTILCALVNGTLIGFFSKVFERLFEFRDAWKLRKFFE